MNNITSVNRVDGKDFIYDYGNSMVYYVFKMSKEIKELENKLNYKSETIGDYMIIDCIGLNNENWKNKESREEYLFNYSIDLNQELASLSAGY